ncbi:tyrosine-type recombinase/integrase [Kitasatospora sp. NPDC056327]|uniref:tyrosine-type recombinase/integrase n=1 Tax=Kitasatospora sp. NPDC056327 TaxID=3345785 RepID=UPI0035D901AF
MHALHRQATIQMNAHSDGRLEGLVFARPGGTPLRPQWVLDQLRKPTTELDLPKIGLHDLRHTAASIMIAADIPLAVVSKTMRHSKLAITINLYSHLFMDSADEAVLALSHALNQAASGWANREQSSGGVLRAAESPAGHPLADGLFVRGSGGGLPQGAVGGRG